MAAIEVPVLIVGGSGCGLSASIFLSDHGVGHLLVERHADTSKLPKAHYINQRTMEIFRQHGLDGAVAEQGASLAKFGKVRWQTTLTGDGPLDARVIHEMDAFGGGAMRETYAAAGPVLPTELPQLRLEPILRRHAEQRNPGHIRFGQELAAFSDDGDRVIAEVRDADTGEITTVAAQYVVAADGGRTVGAALGVEMQGVQRMVDVTTAYFSADLSAWWHDGTIITWFLNPYRPDLSSTLLEMGPTWGKGCEEWGLHFTPGDADRSDEQAIVSRIREVLGLPGLDLTLHKVTHWTVEGVLADRYRDGRVLLVGDAVHRQPPTTGLGLNGGIQDAHNLAWKLAAVLTGRAHDSLLDTYEAERRPLGKYNVDWGLATWFHHKIISEAAVGLGPHIPPERRTTAFSAYFDPSPVGTAVRARAAEIFGTHRAECQAHDLDIGFAYEEGAVIPDGSRPPPRAPMGDVYHPTTRPGHLLPHAWIERDGCRLSTHDLTGAATSFALLTGLAGTPWREAAALRRRRRLGQLPDAGDGARLPGRLRRAAGAGRPGPAGDDVHQPEGTGQGVRRLQRGRGQRRGAGAADRRGADLRPVLAVVPVRQSGLRRSRDHRRRAAAGQAAQEAGRPAGRRSTATPRCSGGAPASSRQVRSKPIPEFLPPYALTFAGEMLLKSRHGTTWRRADYQAWLAKAGFEEVSFQSTPSPATLIFAR